ncbi:MAG: hypothetical protein ACT4OZ_14355 [Gemmatimonadota bacterium]
MFVALPAFGQQPLVARSTAPLVTAAPPALQIRQARAPENRMRRGILIGAVTGAALFVSYVVLEDMLSGDLFDVENAEKGITPQRIVGYTAVGAVVGGVMGATVVWLRGDRSASGAAPVGSGRSGRSAPAPRADSAPPLSQHREGRRRP